MQMNDIFSLLDLSLFTEFPGTLRRLLLVRRPPSAPDAVPVDGDDRDVPRGAGLVQVDGGRGRDRRRRHGRVQGQRRRHRRLASSSPG